MNRKSAARIALFSLTALGASALLARMFRAVANRELAEADEEVREEVLARDPDPESPLALFFKAISATEFLLSMNGVVALGTCRRGARAWLPVVLGPLLVKAAGMTCERMLPLQYAPTSKDGKPKPSFPSDHAMAATAELLVPAYILVREELLTPAALAAIVVIPVGAGLNRLVRDRHWASDVVAGWTAGVIIASVCCLVSELVFCKDQR